MRNINTFKTATLLFVILLSSSAKAQSIDSLDIKIGQMILIGFAGTAVDSAVLREIQKGKVGSIIIFEKNIPKTNSFVALKKINWTYQKAAAIPLLISIDQEGGKVNRLKDKYGFPKSITAFEMGKNASLDSVRFYSEATASTLAGLGINVNFAPDVDLIANPDNPVIVKHGRAFSANEDTVIMMAKEVIKKHREMNVITALKHFPGHGSSKADTHLGIADVTNTWSERELKPYQALIDSGYADAVMTSHIVNMNLDKSGKPGTLSFDILTGMLRNKLHFNGVIFTDDMQMHAITEHYGLEEAIKLAINGGVDIMTFSNNIQGSDVRTVDRVHEIIKKMVADGVIKKARIDESFKRIMKLKSRLTNPIDYQQQYEKAAQEVQSLKAMQQKQLEMAEKMYKEALEQSGKKKKSKKKKKS
ncbi:MAG TPA: glycoside hydrolase family 3 N-terminal domain-containing protein [Chryseolinea sp.]|nr:glycoside hydrolase family 3 N-terminal domain-containing protein [Chryseolinea sp.]HPH46242.1 glycoside hydrolase family 3 N-terminal domain-containing protein [Chryseolinea sp.]HPM28873.1 glycoside hydrolase family 3 N-terminal domain-containing protein [Chryseolinea sp.]